MACSVCPARAVTHRFLGSPRTDLVELSIGGKNWILFESPEKVDIKFRNLDAKGS